MSMLVSTHTGSALAFCVGRPQSESERQSWHRAPASTPTTRAFGLGDTLLYLHEIHKVKGLKEDDFEARYRDGWMSMMADTDYARLLWYTHHAVGSGVSYNVITITGINDGAGWEDLVKRCQKGDLQSWLRDTDELRYDVIGKILVPLHWSPMQDLDLGTVPTDGSTHPLTMYMEDTMWPPDVLRYIEACGSVYSKSLEHTDEELFITIDLALTPALGTNVRREASLMQKIHNIDRLTWLLTNDIAPEHRGPGTWMYDGLEFRDQWESKLLRTSAWSPLW
jgi:hypothetical protein